MTLKQIGIYTFQLPLLQTLFIKGQPVAVREGIILRVRDSHNHIGYGEISPLPGLHKETLEACAGQIIRIQSELTGAYLPKPAGIFGFLDTILPRPDWLPSVRFGLEMALITLFPQRELMDDAPAFLPVNQERIKINLLLTGSRGDTIRMLKRGLDQGFRVIKVKVGQGNPEEEGELIRMICRLGGPGIRLRLDANRSWHLNEALSFIRSIQDCPVEYVEEPLQDPDQLPVLAEEMSFPIALDETLSELRPEKFRLMPWMSAFILKPAAIGSLSDVLAYIRLAELKRRKIVITDSFQTGVGLAFLVRLAASLKEAIPMGFNTYNYLKEDILTERIQSRGDEIQVHQTLEQAKKVNDSKLQELSDSLALDEPTEKNSAIPGNNLPSE